MDVRDRAERTKVVQMAAIHLCNRMLWRLLNDTNEANARRLVENLRPDLPLELIVTWLADDIRAGLPLSADELSDAD